MNYFNKIFYYLLKQSTRFKQRNNIIFFIGEYRVMNKMLLPYDIVGGSFWLISVAMIGATLFSFSKEAK